MTTRGLIDMKPKELYEKVLERAGQGIKFSEKNKDRYIQKKLIESAYLIGVHVGMSDKENLDKLFNEFDGEEN